MNDVAREPDEGADAVAAPENGSLVGQVVADRFLVIEKLGEGGMGTVYVAEQIALRKPVALKVIHPSIAGDGDIRERFEREAMASSKLEGHPHVASATDLGKLPDGSLYLVMQLVRGTSLEKRIGEGPIPWVRAAAMGAQIADALAAAHALGIIHRDLKPDNVMLVTRDDGSELVKVLDFGLARISENAPTTGNTVIATSAPSEQKLTRMGTIMGTPGYMSPEQAIGDVVDHRTDLYALGVILWEMLVGRTLFDGQDFQSILARQFGQAIEPPSRVGDPSIPETLDRLVLSLLGARASDRPNRASDVRDLLHDLVLQMRSELSRTGTHPAISLPSVDGLTLDRTTSSFSLAAAQAPPQPPQVATTQAGLPAVFATRGAKIAGVIVALLAALVLARVALSGPEETSLVPSVPSLLPPMGPQLSPELDAAVATIASSSDRRAREAAATLLLAAPESEPVPPYAKALAELEKARNCRSKRDIVVRVGTIGEDDALPYLRRLRATPRDGCGFLGTRDCLSCLRDELETAYTTLGGD